MGRPGKYFRMLFPDPEVRKDSWDFYVHWKNLYCMGEGEIGFLRHFLGFQSLVVYYLGLDNVLAKLGINLIFTWWIVLLIPILLFFKIAFYIAVGFFWDRNKMPHRFTEWSNRRNPTLKSIHDMTAGRK